jgi:hypothetical protein
MKKNRRQASFGIAVVSLAVILSCAPQVTLTPLGTEQAYPPTPDSVAISLYATTKPECPYDEIAAITAEGQTFRSVEAEVLSALKAKARAIGAHAIIGYTQSNRAASTASGESRDVHVRSGTAIRFRLADCTR